MNKRHYFNDLDHLYEQEPERDWTKMEFTCPVCKKKYSTASGIYKHMAQKDCAPATKMFADTLTEDLALAFFKDTVGKYNPKQRTNVQALRRSKSYKPLMRFILHCMNNKEDPYMFFYWITDAKKPRYYNQALSMGLKDTMLVEYRDFLIKNQHLIESEQFFEQNKEELLTDNWQLIRSMERGDIGLDYCINNEEIDIYNRVNQMNSQMKLALSAIVGKAESK